MSSVVHCVEFCCRKVSLNLIINMFELIKIPCSQTYRWYGLNILTYSRHILVPPKRLIDFGNKKPFVLEVLQLAVLVIDRKQEIIKHQNCMSSITIASHQCRSVHHLRLDVIWLYNYDIILQACSAYGQWAWLNPSCFLLSYLTSFILKVLQQSVKLLPIGVNKELLTYQYFWIALHVIGMNFVN